MKLILNSIYGQNQIVLALHMKIQIEHGFSLALPVRNYLTMFTSSKPCSFLFYFVFKIKKYK